MARTQGILTRSPGDGVDLEDLILDELQAQAAQEDQYRCHGPRIGLSPKAAEVVTLAIHELATNATKYGAFADRQGRVDVRWCSEERESGPWLRLTWSENGLDLGSASARSGFGTELITRRVPYELRGEGVIEMRPQGLRAAICFPLTESRSILQPGAEVTEAAR
jgi:two-component sensor histidine kinase